MYKKVKFCIISNLYHPNIVGGAERMAQLLAENLVQLGHEVFVLTIQMKEDQAVEIINGVKVYYLDIKNVYLPYTGKHSSFAKIIWHLLDSYNLKAFRQIKSIISRENPDIIHTHNLAGFSTAAWRCGRALSIPVVHTIHDYYLLCYKSTMYTNHENCQKQCTFCGILSIPKRFATKGVQGVIGVSDFILNRHLSYKYFQNTNLNEVIYNGLPEVNSQQVLHYEKKKTVYGYIGRLSPEKGLEQALDAFRESGSPFEFFVAGKGDIKYVTYLQEKYKSNQISFLGTMNNLSFYRLINVLVLPSLWNEPLATVVLEAFRSGIPVLGYKTGGTPELIQEGFNGFLFGTFDKLKMLFTEDKLSEDIFRKNSLESFRKYRLQNYIDKHLEFYQKVLKNSYT